MYNLPKEALMAVRIRLSRIGKKHAPFYRVVAVDGRKKRDGAFLEDLGTYDGLKSVLVRFETDRIAHWISQGAIPSDAVKRLQILHKRSSVGGSEPVAEVAAPAPKKEKAAKAKA
jgi:small subunit ribosomal protein S16